MIVASVISVLAVATGGLIALWPSRRSAASNGAHPDDTAAGKVAASVWRQWITSDTAAAVAAQMQDFRADLRSLNRTSSETNIALGKIQSLLSDLLAEARRSGGSASRRQ